MDTARDAAAADRVTVERTSAREMVVRRTFSAPPARVFAAWTQPELLVRWWAPRSVGVAFVSCEADARTGGAYRFVMSHPGVGEPMAFFGRYLDVEPPSRLVWTNEEAEDGGQVTTVTFEADGAGTLVVMRELFPSETALDVAISSQSASGVCETFEQLDGLLVTLGEGV